MKTTFRQLVQFDPRPAAVTEFQVPIHRHRETVRRRFAKGLVEHGKLIDLALNEAEALAWQTPFPHLFFPALAEEKAGNVALWGKRQRAIQRRGRERMLTE